MTAQPEAHTDETSSGEISTFLAALERAWTKGSTNPNWPQTRTTRSEGSVT